MDYIRTTSSVVRAGDIFGNYTVKDVFRRPGKYPKYAVVECSCGSRARFVKLSCLRSGEARSCGCYQREAVTKHGLWKNPVFRCWKAMMSRCYNPKDKRFARYGGRGISVCERWQNPKHFVEDMTPDFAPGLTIERIENNREYEPNNCRWATHAEQNRNYSRNIVLEYAGESMCLKDWSIKIGLNYGTLWERYKTGWSIEKMLTTPPRGKKTC